MTLIERIVTDKTNISKIFIIVLISFFLLFGCSNKKNKILIVEKIELPDNYAVPIEKPLGENIKFIPGSEPLIPPEPPESLKIGKTPQTVQYEIPPKVLKKVPIEYPMYFKNKKFKGVVILEVEILKNVKVGQINVTKSFSPGPGHLDEAALKAVKQWEFSPALAIGKPVACWLEIPIELKNK